MTNFDLMLKEIIEEIEISSETSESQILDVLCAYNSDHYGMGHKLKMIAWDQQ